MLMIAKIKIDKSALGGLGHFAVTDIPKGQDIVIFEGELCNLREINNRIVKGAEREDDPLQIDDDLFIDLDDESRLFNHSCNPNAGISGRSRLVAIRDIAKHEEITFDYSTTVGREIAWSMDCNCGYNGCREKIGNILTVPEPIIKRYMAAGAIQDFIRKQLKI